MYILIGDSQFELNTIPSSFSDFKILIQDTYGLFPEYYDYMLVTDNQETKLEEDAYTSSIGEVEDLDNCKIKLIEKPKPKEKAEKSKEKDVNALLNMLMTLSVIDSSLDISKIFCDKHKDNSEEAKKAKASKNPKRNDFKDQKFLAKSKSFSKNTVRIVQP
jgi:hypothetical protein